MRFVEFADAEAQLGLLRLIIDNTWTAIAQQAEQQRRSEAESKAKAATKPRPSRASVSTPTKVQPPKLAPAPPPPKPAPTPAKPQRSVSLKTPKLGAQSSQAQQVAGPSFRLKNSTFLPKAQAIGAKSNALQNSREDGRQA
jgi:hypothetical protein